MSIEDIGRPVGDAKSLERSDILQQAAEQQVEQRLRARCEGRSPTLDDLRAELVTTEARRLRLWGTSIKIVDDLTAVRDALRAAIARGDDAKEHASLATERIEKALTFHVSHRGKL